MIKRYANPEETHDEHGWICLHRKSLVNGWLKNHKLWVFWCYCLLKASHRVHKVMIGNQQITLQPGQFIFGRKEASKETGMSEQAVRTCVHNLYTLKNLTIKSTNKFSLITIVNWELYQDKEMKVTSKVTSNQPVTNHIQQLNNGTIKKKKKKKREKTHLLLSEPLKKEESRKNPPEVNLSKSLNGKKKNSGMTDEEWLAMVKTNPAYQGLDVDKVKAKLEAWCITNGKKPTRKRLLNWLNREEKPFQFPTKQEPARDAAGRILQNATEMRMED